MYIRRSNMVNLKNVIFSIIFILITTKEANSLNSFEIALLGIGTAFIADQYFDSSLNTTNRYQLKNEVVEKFYENRKKSVSNNYFKHLPIQEKLLLIEELEKNF